MAKILDVLEAVRRIISKWVATEVVLLSNAAPGDTILNVKSTVRLSRTDELLLRDSAGTIYETPLIVAKVIDNTHVELTNPLQFAWSVSNGSVLVRAIHKQFVQAIYLGGPENITHYPAITVNGTSSTSEWLTIRGTKEHYEIEIGVYVLDSTFEEGYRFLLEVTEMIQRCLKRNVFPLVNDYEQVAITADTQPGDIYIKVADTSIFQIGNLVLLEDQFTVDSFRIDNICDATTLLLTESTEKRFLVSNGASVIRCRRFIYNSWPSSTDYGKLHTGTMLKASVTKFFCEECEDQFLYPNGTSTGPMVDPQLH